MQHVAVVCQEICKISFITCLKQAEFSTCETGSDISVCICICIYIYIYLINKTECVSVCIFGYLHCCTTIKTISYYIVAQQLKQVEC
jgi:hypothetical protein